MINSKLIDHTLLKAFATSADVQKICQEAIKYNFKSVCINPDFVSLASEELKDSDVLVCTVIGFPLGANTTETKIFEASNAIENGADELDMVINISKAKEHDYQYIEKEIKELVKVANGRTVKIIIETCYLSDEEKIEICKAATRAHANFVKTSTGFGTGGAVREDVELMRANIATNMFVKASGGIHSASDVVTMVNAGASRIGASAGVAIMQSQEQKK